MNTFKVNYTIRASVMIQTDKTAEELIAEMDEGEGPLSEASLKLNELGHVIEESNTDDVTAI